MLILESKPKTRRNFRHHQGKANHLITLEGVRFDSHKFFIIAPFQVDRNFENCSDLCSVSDEKPAVPTRIKCCTCLGYCKNKHD